MHRLAVIFWPAVGLTILGASCFGSVLFRGEQFAYRDAAHYYYPLHQRTAAQWRSGHLPLWDSAENGGMPLLGNPTAAVLYPGKVVFGLLPFAWATRVYLVAHVALAFGAMVVLMRGLGIGGTGATLGGLAYAFGGPVLFLYSNAIYLVGAAWLPLGFLAVEGWVRRGRSRSLALLAFVLAMQCLGGDVQSSYALGLFAASYAVWSGRAAIAMPRLARWLVMALASWVVVTLVVAWWLPGGREWKVPEPILDGLTWLVRAGCLVAVAVVVVRSHGGRVRTLTHKMLGLVAAAVVGFALAGVQMMPVFETAARSDRFAGGRPTNAHHFSVEPYRLVEGFWPGFFGVEFPENRLWLLAIPPHASHALWSASLYAGGLTLVLAISALRTPGAAPWKAPMAAMGLAAVVLSLGRFGGPLWWARGLPGLSALLGPIDAGGTGFFRPEDGQVRDGFGSAYGILASLAPGFGGFRFPAKFLSFALLALASLAALGWDRLADGSGRRAGRAAWGLLEPSVVGLALTFAFGGPMLGWFERSARVPSVAGPLDPPGCLAEVRRSLWHGAIVAAGASLVVVAASRGHRLAGPVAIVFLALDLAVANARIVWTVPQADFDRTPEALAAIARAEARSPSAGPFRVHRPLEWRPVDWVRARSPDRLREVVAWERDSLQASYGTAEGLEFVLSPGVIEPVAYAQMFDPWELTPDPTAAREIGGVPGRPMHYFPRRAFDLWGARYFLLPAVADDWSSPHRAIASLVVDSERVYPPAQSPERERRWREHDDWQVFRNPDAYPRAWVVHDARIRPTLAGGWEGTEASSWRKAILYKPDPFWQIPDRPADDPRRLAWIEADDPASFRLDLSRAPVSSEESVVIEPGAPGRVELTARLTSPGLVVLADSYDPGWSLTIDGRPAPVLRANRMMRAAAVPAGEHHLVFVYEPATFRVGLILSAAGLIGLVALAAWKSPDREGHA